MDVVCLCFCLMLPDTYMPATGPPSPLSPGSHVTGGTRQRRLNRILCKSFNHLYNDVWNRRIIDTTVGSHLPVFNFSQVSLLMHRHAQKCRLPVRDADAKQMDCKETILQHGKPANISSSKTHVHACRSTPESSNRTQSRPSNVTFDA